MLSAGTAMLMLTSAGMPEDVDRCRELGIHAYLNKPVKQSELLEAIFAALGQTGNGLAGAAKIDFRSIEVSVREGDQLGRVQLGADTHAQGDVRARVAHDDVAIDRGTAGARGNDPPGEDFDIPVGGIGPGEIEDAIP